MSVPGDPLASPAHGVVPAGVPQTHAATTSTPKETLSVKDAEFDTPLTHATSAVWFRRILVAAETLSCEDALTDDNADPVASSSEIHPLCESPR